MPASSDSSPSEQQPPLPVDPGAVVPTDPETVGASSSPGDAQGSALPSSPGELHHMHILDDLLGTNPDKSFADSALEKFFGTDADATFLRSQPGDSDATLVGRAIGDIVTLRAWGLAALGGGVLDDINHLNPVPWGMVIPDSPASLTPETPTHPAPTVPSPEYMPVDPAVT